MGRWYSSFSGHIDINHAMLENPNTLLALGVGGCIELGVAPIAAIVEN
jgi:hypothetical protein